MRKYRLLNEEAELPLLAAPRSRTQFVSSPEELEAAIANLRGGYGAFCLDAERASGFKYSQRAYLVQVSRQNADIFLIDPIAFEKGELDSLAALLATDTWILHAATQDLPCLAELGLSPTELFDTELIGRLLGFERVGLGAVCERLLGLRLAKEHSAADWSVRPIPDAWLIYAALDVDVLSDLKAALEPEIEAQGKQEIIRQEMHHLLSFTPKAQKLDKWRGMSGCHDLKDSRQLAIARELWTARESLAQKLDVSPGRLVPDKSIAHAAQQTYRTKSELAGDKLFNGRASRSYLDTWWDSYQRGATERDLPPVRVKAEGIPNHRNWAKSFPEAHDRLSKAREVVAEVSESLKIPAENLITPDYLRQVCFEPAGLDVLSIRAQLGKLGARDWQLDAIAEKISLRLEAST